MRNSLEKPQPVMLRQCFHKQNPSTEDTQVLISFLIILPSLPLLLSSPVCLFKVRERVNHRGQKIRIKRVRTEKEGLGLRNKLNDIRASMLLTQDDNQEFQGMLADWDTKNQENEEDNQANIEVALMLNDHKRVEPKILEKTIFKHHASVLLKKRYITERPIDNPTQIIRQQLTKKAPPIKELAPLLAEVKEAAAPAKKSTVKSLYIKKVNLVVKIKEQNDRGTITRQSTKAKSLFFSSQQPTKREYKHPKLQRVSLDRQSMITRSKKISFPNHSHLHNQLSQLNKLLSTECVSIRQKIAS